jgi:hypothetical protein
MWRLWGRGAGMPVGNDGCGRRRRAWPATAGAARGGGQIEGERGNHASHVRAWSDWEFEERGAKGMSRAQHSYRTMCVPVYL